ncbi:hypothetical protein KCU99_g5433, partial [Aureobasidium melanogenum]
MEPADDPEVVILKRGRSYHAVIAQTNRVKHYLTMERPMPTVTAALEYLLDITSEHLGNIHDTCFAGRATPPTQFGETVENDLWYPSTSHHLRHIEASLLQTDCQHLLQVQLRPLVGFELLDDVLPRWKVLMQLIQHEATLCAGVHASGELETSHKDFIHALYLLDL